MMFAGKVLLAASNQGLARAQGNTSGGWLVISPLSGQRVRSLAAAAQASNTVFAGTDDGVLRSDDRGQTWQPAWRARSSPRWPSAPSSRTSSMPG